VGAVASREVRRDVFPKTGRPGRPFVPTARTFVTMDSQVRSSRAVCGYQRAPTLTRDSQQRFLRQGRQRVYEPSANRT
jgi:hypothetical protein